MPWQLNDTAFSLELPDAFSAQSDEAGYTLVCSEPPAVLTLMAQQVEDKDELPNLSRMLAGFLTRSGHPVATDELLKVTSIPNVYGFSWQYDEDGNFHRLWLFGNEAAWLLMTFVCPVSCKQDFHESTQSLVKTLRLRE